MGASLHGRRVVENAIAAAKKDVLDSALPRLVDGLWKLTEELPLKRFAVAELYYGYGQDVGALVFEVGHLAATMGVQDAIRVATDTWGTEWAVRHLGALSYPSNVPFQFSSSSTLRKLQQSVLLSTDRIAEFRRLPTSFHATRLLFLLPIETRRKVRDMYKERGELTEELVEEIVQDLRQVVIYTRAFASARHYAFRLLETEARSIYHDTLQAVLEQTGGVEGWTVYTGNGRWVDVCDKRAGFVGVGGELPPWHPLCRCFVEPVVSLSKPSPPTQFPMPKEAAEYVAGALTKAELVRGLAKVLGVPRNRLKNLRKEKLKMMLTTGGE